VRLPGRIGGLVAGLAVLAVTPILAIGHAQHAALTATARPVEAPAAPQAAVVAGQRLSLPRDALIEIRAPEPTPPPTPPPTPAPTPTPVTPTVRPAVVAAPAPAPAPPAGSIEAIIAAAAAKYGVSDSWMLKIARCESSLNPRAYNPAGPYIGLFQFLPSTFRAHGGTDIYDPVQQADITANMLAHGQARAWGCA
jgi:soluble lytic murein transglycosylase-like protein